MAAAHRAAGAAPFKPATPAAPNPTEEQWQTKVVEYAHLFGWYAAHFRPARTIHGWRTPGQYDAKGWPDLVLVHPERQLILYREIKARHGRLDADQYAWRERLEQAGADYAVWTPADEDDVVATLAGERWQLRIRL